MTTKAPTQPARRDALERRIRDYHGVGIEQVLEAIAYLRDEGDSVIVGGSLAMGLGNRLSDLDVVIAGSQTVESSRVPLEHFVGSLRVDVWKMAHGLIDEVFARAEDGLAHHGRLDSAFGNVDDETNLKLLHRVAFGISLDGPPVEPDSSRDHAAIAREVVAREYAERTREHALLAQMAVSSGHRTAAVLSAREAVEAALHATIAMRQLPFTGDKWLQERLANDVPDLDSRYRPFATVPESPDETAAFVRAAIDECGALTGLDLAAGVVAADCAWRNTDLELVSVGTSTLLLSLGGGVLWELDEAEAETWKGLVARAGEDAPSATWPCAECSEPENALCFALHEQGLLNLEWARGVPIADLHVSLGESG